MPRHKVIPDPFHRAPLELTPEPRSRADILHSLTQDILPAGRLGLLTLAVPLIIPVTSMVWGQSFEQAVSGKLRAGQMVTSPLQMRDANPVCGGPARASGAGCEPREEHGQVAYSPHHPLEPRLCRRAPRTDRGIRTTCQSPGYSAQ